MHRICAVCGKEFEPPKGSSRATCSQSCCAAIQQEKAAKSWAVRREKIASGEIITKPTKKKKANQPKPNIHKKNPQPKECRKCRFYDPNLCGGSCDFLVRGGEKRGIAMELCAAGAAGSRFQPIPPKKRGPKPREGV